jgi:hypothetical protein
MRDSSHPNRLIRLPRARLLAVATLVSGALAAGCGGSSHSPTAATVRAVTTSRLTAAAAGGAASSRATAQSASGSGPLAFAKCMRANGVPNFPDPNAGGGGGARFPIPTGSNPAAPAFKAAQARCQRLIGGPVGGPLSPGATTHPSAQTLAKLLKIARCMRQNGVPQFPDPRTSVPSNATGYQEVTDFDGAILLFPSTINLQAPAYKQALTACGAPRLGLPH